MDHVLVSIDRVSKGYPLYAEPIDRVREALNPFGRCYHKVFKALDDVSFELRRGESLGVIGKNGHGKSTLLKIVAGIVRPSEGTVEVRGRTSAILEVSSNLNPQLSGRRNAEFGLQLAGVPASERDAKLDAIVDFADIGEFIEHPVKMYSSGMKSRLGFAIATEVDPDVLILDEVLAVGDFEFQQKCLARMNELRQRMSVLFVSHSMNSVRHFCDNAIVLEKGKVGFSGTAENATEYYLEQQISRKKELGAKAGGLAAPFFGDLFDNPEKIEVRSHGWTVDSPVATHAPLRFEFDFELRFEPRNLIVGVPIWNVERRELVTSVISDFSGVEIPVRDGRCRGSVEIQCQLNPGTYLSSFNVRDGVEYLYRQLNSEFAIHDHRRSFGTFTHDARWAFESK